MKLQFDGQRYPKERMLCASTLNPGVRQLLFNSIFALFPHSPFSSSLPLPNVVFCKLNGILKVFGSIRSPDSLAAPSLGTLGRLSSPAGLASPCGSRSPHARNLVRDAPSTCSEEFCSRSRIHILSKSCKTIPGSNPRHNQETASKAASSIRARSSSR